MRLVERNKILTLHQQLVSNCKKASGNTKFLNSEIAQNELHADFLPLFNILPISNISPTKSCKDYGFHQPKNNINIKMDWQLKVQMLRDTCHSLIVRFPWMNSKNWGGCVNVTLDRNCVVFSSVVDLFNRPSGKNRTEPISPHGRKGNVGKSYLELIFIKAKKGQCFR